MELETEPCRFEMQSMVEPRSEQTTPEVRTSGVLAAAVVRVDEDGERVQDAVLDAAAEAELAIAGGVQVHQDALQRLPVRRAGVVQVPPQDGEGALDVRAVAAGVEQGTEEMAVRDLLHLVPLDGVGRRLLRLGEDGAGFHRRVLGVCVDDAELDGQLDDVVLLGEVDEAVGADADRDLEDEAQRSMRRQRVAEVLDEGEVALPRCRSPKAVVDVADEHDEAEAGFAVVEAAVALAHLELEAFHLRVEGTVPDERGLFEAVKRAEQEVDTAVDGGVQLAVQLGQQESSFHVELEQVVAQSYGHCDQ